MKRRAFTLVELLIVLAVIGLLVSILLPVLSKARESGRRAVCSNNLRQFGMAIQMYTQDYDGRYGFASFARNGNPLDVVYWWMATEPYHKQPRLYLCPNGVLDQNVGNAQGAAHYGVNRQVMKPTSFLTSNVKSPSTTYLIMDAGTFDLDPSYYRVPGQLVSTRYLPGMGAFTPLYPSLTNPDYIRDFYFGRHLSGMLVAYCDGHVKWHPTELVIREALSPGSGQWSPNN